MQTPADKTLPSGGAPEEDMPMTLMEHLSELRRRLILAVGGIIPGIAIAWVFKEELLDLLLAPLITAWNKLGLGEPTIHFANPIDMFVAYLKIAIVVGILVASPWLFWQVWGFISPGLFDREKRLAIPFSAASAVFFAGGAFFGYLVVFPLGFQTFLSLSGMLPSGGVRVQPTLMINEYLTFATRMLLAFGVVFEIPVVVTFLALARIVDWRQLLRFGRWWALVAAVLSSLLTPPDPGSMMLMMVPLIVLYFMSVGIAYLIGMRSPRPDEDE